MVEATSLQKRLTRDTAHKIVTRYCEYDTEIPLGRRLCLLADEFNTTERKVHCILVLALGANYFVEPFKEYVYW